MGGRPKVNNVQFFTDDTCSDSIPLVFSNEITLTSDMISCSGIKSGTTPCATALLSTTNQYWEPSCDPCYVDEAWLKVTFTTSTTVRCIQLSGTHPLGKSEGDTADLIWSGGLHVLNNNGLDQISINSNRWTGRGIGDRLVADTKADCKVCPSGMYQQEVGKLECKNCPAGTIRAISSNDDDIHWNGDSGGNGDRTKADDETDCKVCEAGRYQNNERQTDCNDCPAGTRRPSTTGSDGQDWDGSTAMSGGNRNVADTKEDCKVCDSGQYQHENKQTECINCPEGTVRYVDTSDNDVWNGANVLDTFHEFTIGHCEESGGNLISTKQLMVQ